MVDVIGRLAAHWVYGDAPSPAFQVDMMDPKALKELVHKVGSKIDVLVNNAGVPPGPCSRELLCAGAAAEGIALGWGCCCRGCLP